MGVLYTVLRPIVATTYKYYFRKIHIVGRDKIPTDKPLLISCNHPMAFTEATMMAVYLKRPLYFLARGDVFDTKFRWALEETNQLPIYRFRDGFSNMRRNSESFERVYQALVDKKVIMIFSEGKTDIRKRLLNIQKGTARLAFGAWEEKGVEDLEVLPIGVNYADGTRFRSDVMVQIGDPIPVKPYLAQYEDNKVDAIKTLTQDIQEAMMPLVIHLDNIEMEPLANAGFEVLDERSQITSWPILDEDDSRFRREKRLADLINQGVIANESDLKRYLESIEFPDEKVFMIERLLKLLLLTLTSPLALMGWLLNVIPFHLTKYIANKKVTQIEFLIPVWLGLIIIIYPLYLLLLLILGFMTVGWLSMALIFLPPLLGYFCIIWKEDLEKALIWKKASDIQLNISES